MQTQDPTVRRFSAVKQIVYNEEEEERQEQDLDFK